MDAVSLGIFLAVVALGSWLQTVTGFALGLVVMGTVSVLNLAPLTFAAIVVSLVALMNIITALKNHHEHVHWRTTLATATGLLPAVMLGLWLLDWLSQEATEVLRILLGVFIMVGGVLLMLKPHPRQSNAPAWMAALTGAVGGLFGGLFSTPGPPIVYHLYREPIPIASIRTTLLSIFAVSTTTRITLVTINGQMSFEILKLAALCVPVVIFCTWLGNRYRPPVSDLSMRRFAFALLMLLGASVIFTNSR